MALLARRSLPGLILSLAALLLLVPNQAVAQEEAVSKEYQIKAAFLYNFAKYVEWPARSFPTTGAPIVIGAYCADEFGEVLKQIVRNRKIGGRGIAVKILASPAEAGSVHMVYVCGGPAAIWGAVVEALQRDAVLTVADLEEPGAPGGMIVFVLDGDKVRFTINMRKAGRAGLKVSDQLQKLAISVTRAP